VQFEPKQTVLGHVSEKKKKLSLVISARYANTINFQKQYCISSDQLLVSPRTALDETGSCCSLDKVWLHKLNSQTTSAANFIIVVKFAGLFSQWHALWKHQIIHKVVAKI
jgi:hypothetical protein